MGKIFVSIVDVHYPNLSATLAALSTHESGDNECRYVFTSYNSSGPLASGDFGKGEFVETPTFPSLRAAIKDKIEDEDYYLQISSGVTVSKNWDRALVNSLHLTGSSKALLSCSLPRLEAKYNSLGIYTGTDHPAGGSYKPEHERNKTGVPIRTMYISDSFHFAPTAWCKDIDYPAVEVSVKDASCILGISSFTHGWTSFCPEKAVFRTASVSKEASVVRPLRNDCLKLGTERSMSEYPVMIGQFSDHFQKLIVDKKKLATDNVISRFELVLNYHDQVLATIPVSDQESVDLSSPYINVDQSLSTRAMATSYTLKAYNDPKRVIKVLKKQYVL